jgi:tetratricopeptide (TPR) repeat protein
MKKIILSFSIAICMLQQSNAQQLKTPAPSPTQTVKQDFALSDVKVSFSRPGVKGRKIFGDLVPFGKVWRTGANGATTISFGDDVIFGGKPVPAGKYGLLTIPGASEWTIILTKQLDVTSPSAYKEDQDVVRVKVTPQTLPFTMENFLIAFDEITPTTMGIALLWDKTSVEIPIKAEIDQKMMTQIDNALKSDTRPYFQSAMYYMETGKDINQAIAWFDKAIEQNPNAFWVYHQKANALAKLGKKQEAVASANKSIELAKVAKNDDYVALNQKLLATLK